MQRTPINPHSWTVNLGFDQAELIEGHQRMLLCSGQDAVDADGRPQHPGDMAAQLELALDNRRRRRDQAIPNSQGPLREQSLRDLGARRREPSSPVPRHAGSNRG